MLKHFQDTSKTQEVLRHAQTGLWVIEIDENALPRMYADSSMLELLGLKHIPSPEECYKIWYDNIVDEYYESVHEAVNKVIMEQRAEVVYSWMHHELGQVYIRCGGVRDLNYTQGVCLRGYHQNITETIQIEQENDAVIRSLSKKYDEIILCNMGTNTYKSVKPSQELAGYANKGLTYDELIKNYVEDHVALEYRKIIYSTTSRELVLEKIARGETQIECLFRMKNGNWRRIKLMPSDDYSPEHPYVILAVDNQDKKIEKRSKETISTMALSNMYVLAVSVDLNKTEYSCIHYSEDTLNLLNYGKFSDFFPQLISIGEDEDRATIEHIFERDSYNAVGYREGDLRLYDKQNELHYYTYYSSIITEDIGERILFMLRNTDDKQQAQKRERVFASLCDAYFSVYLLDLKKNTHEILLQEKSLSIQGFDESTDLYSAYSNYIKGCVVDEDQERMLKIVEKGNLEKRLTSENPAFDIDYRRNYQGHMSWVRSRFSLGEMKDGVVAKVIFANMNIDEQKRRELEEQEQKELNFKYQNIIHGLASFYNTVMFIDLSGEKYQMLRHMPDIGGCFNLENDYRRFITSYAEGFVKQEDRERFLYAFSPEGIKTRLETGDAIYYEDYSRNYGGYYGWMRVYIILAESENGEPVKVLLAAHSIEEEKEEEERNRQALQMAYESAKAANEAKTDFLAQMSHDIRTPMNAIVGMTSIARAHLSDPGKLNDCLEKINVSSKHLLALINEILDMTKIESGRIDLTEDSFNLQELIYDMSSILRSSIEEKNHEIRVVTKSITHEDLIGDVGRIRQVFLNLLSNAVKYTPDGGRIQVTVEELPIAVPGYGNFRVTIEDNGMGMSPEFLEVLFQPFERAEEAKTKNIPGTGLGMAITKSIISIMQGNIQVESEIGKGSTFIVNLFLKIADEETFQLSAEVTGAILVVDDDEHDCSLACTALEEIGVKWEKAFSGKQAFEMIKKAMDEGHPYFAAIVDWKMPEVGGVESIRLIRDQLSTNMPIIIHTAYDWTVIEEEAITLGVDGFISKPVNKSKMYHIINKLLNKDKSFLRQTAKEIDKPLKGLKILLAEDNELNQEIAKELLTMAGADVEIAINGKRALDLVKEKKEYYSLVLMDIRMPVMDGYEATKAIRKIGREDTDRLPILAMTANTFAEDISQAFVCGMNDHIAKPIDIQQLIFKLQKYV